MLFSSLFSTSLPRYSPGRRAAGAFLPALARTCRGRRRGGHPALLEALGPRGTLLMPALSYASVGPKNPLFDAARHPVLRGRAARVLPHPARARCARSTPPIRCAASGAQAARAARRARAGQHPLRAALRLCPAARGGRADPLPGLRAAPQHLDARGRGVRRPALPVRRRGRLHAALRGRQRRGA